MATAVSPGAAIGDALRDLRQPRHEGEQPLACLLGLGRQPGELGDAPPTQERRHDLVVVDEDGAVLIPAAYVEEITAEAPEQERLESWIMEEVERGVPLPGLYPPNAETKARYEASKKR